MSREEILALGHHYLNDGLYEEAYKCYNELKNMGLYSRSINIYLKVAEILERGDQYLILGERDEARECYKQLESKDIYKDYNYGFPVLVLKIYYEKILFLKQMANTSNDDLKTIYKVIKANTYLKNGLFDKASNIYKKLISSYECTELGVSGFVAAKINNGELAKAKDCFDNKKHLLSKKFYYAIKCYIEYKRKGEYEQMLKRISLYHITERHMNDCDKNVGIFNDDVRKFMKSSFIN